MIYITGDTHREFYRLHDIEKNKNNMLIILGDAGINYYLDERDNKLKEKLNSYNIKLFCVQGNHEERPENISTYKEVDMFGGKVFIEEEYPNLIFAKNGELYEIDNKKVLVIGGAYSVDKEYRQLMGLRWFADEELTDNEMCDILDKIDHKTFDYVFTHTCPEAWQPTDLFIKHINQSKISKRMEKFLTTVSEIINFKHWYFGHFHDDRENIDYNPTHSGQGNVSMLFNKIVRIM